MHCPIFVIIIHHHRVTTQVDKNIDIKIQEREVRSISSSLSSVAFMRENEGNNHMDICHHFPCCCFAVYTISHFLFLIFPFIIGIIVNFQSCFHVSFLFIISCFWCFFLVLLFLTHRFVLKSAYIVFPFQSLVHSISHSRKNLISFLEQVFQSLILSFSCCLFDNDDDGSCELPLIRKWWWGVVHCMCFHCLCCQLCRVCKGLVWRFVCGGEYLLVC